MITKSAKEKRLAERRREVAMSRTIAFERAFYAREDAEFLSRRDERQKPKACLDRPLSRLDERYLVWCPQLSRYVTRREVAAVNKAAGSLIVSYWEK